MQKNKLGVTNMLNFSNNQKNLSELSGSTSGAPLFPGGLTISGLFISLDGNVCGFSQKKESLLQGFLLTLQGIFLYYPSIQYAFQIHYIRININISRKHRRLLLYIDENTFWFIIITFQPSIRWKMPVSKLHKYKINNVGV